MNVVRQSLAWLQLILLVALAAGIPLAGPLAGLLTEQTGAAIAGLLAAAIGISLACGAVSEWPDAPGRLKVALRGLFSGLGRLAPLLLGIELLVVGLRIAVSIAPNLEEMLAGVVDPVLAPAWAPLADLGTAIGLPEAVVGVPLGPILLFGALLVLRNIAFHRLDAARGGRSRSGARRTTILIKKAGKLQPFGPGTGPGGGGNAPDGPVLEPTEMELTFLSIDIVDPTALKSGEDPYIVDHTFTAYRKLVERSLDRYQAYKQTWTPDGQMAAFHSPQAAVWCARDILSKLDDFNRKTSRIEESFRIRAGANLGTVTTDDQTPMEAISNFCIDVAGHMQKHAAPDTLWISRELFEALTDQTGFEPTGEKVDGREVYQWTPGE